MRTVLLVLLLLAAACGPRTAPKRNSPVPTSIGAPKLDKLVAVDARRDGVFATSDGAVMSSPSTELFRLPGEAFSEYTRLVSRSDSDVAVTVGDRVFRWDGAKATELTLRLQAALIIAHRNDPLSYAVQAMDLDSNGDLAIAVQVNGQGTDAPQGQLCFLRAGADACESTNAITKDDIGAADDVLVEAGRVLLVANFNLYQRAPGGSWSLLADNAKAGSVLAVNPLADGRAYFHTSPSSELMNVPSVHVLRADGTEEAAFSAGFPQGHSPKGLWWWGIDSEDDGSCRFSISSSCMPTVLWRQLVVSHTALDGTVTEIGHLDDPKGADLTALTLADGRLRLELEDGVFELAVP